MTNILGIHWVSTVLYSLYHFRVLNYHFWFCHYYRLGCLYPPPQRPRSSLLTQCRDSPVFSTLSSCSGTKSWPVALWHTTPCKRLITARLRPDSSLLTCSDEISLWRWGISWIQTFSPWKRKLWQCLCVRWGLWLTWWRSASQWMWFSSSCAGWSPWGPWVAWCPVAWGCPLWSVAWRCHSVCPVSPSPRPAPSQTAVTSLLSSHRPWVVSRTAAGSLRTLDTNGDDALQTYFQIQQGYKSIQYQRGLQQTINLSVENQIN